MPELPDLPPSLTHHVRMMDMNLHVGRMIAQAGGMTETLEAIQAVDAAVTRDLERAVREASSDTTDPPA